LVSRRFIQDLLDRVRIEEVVSNYVTLKRSGNSLRGLCPFHGETSPSFHVSPSKGFYYCFGCRSGGNAVKFIQEIEGKSFIEVIRMLAEREGIPIPDEELDSRAEQREKQRYARQRRHLELLRAAAGVYEKFLWKSPAGERARKYLASRGISDETAGKFRLGYAPDGGIGLSALIRSLKVSPQDALDVGLLRHGRDGSFYELFRSRLVFPIIVPGGNIVAFSARALPGTQEEKVKYINSPDTVYFHKGEILYGMAQALPAVRRSGTVILVEGNFDLIAMVQAGFENAAAPLGSALTERHVEAIRRLGAGIVLLFDGDDGGARAARRAFEIIVAGGVPVRIALLPRGEDPHSFLSSSGRRGMEKVLADSRDMAGYMIEQQALEAGDGDVERVKALRSLWDILRKTPDELVRGEMLKKLPQAFRMSEREVKDYLGFREKARVEAVAEAVPEKGEAVKRELEIIIGAAIDVPSIAPDIYNRSQDVIEDFSVQRILHQLAAAADESRSAGEPPDYAGIAEGIVDEGLRDWFMRRAVGEGAQFEDEQEALRACLDCLEKLHKESMEKEIRQQGQMAQEARDQGDDDRYMKILAEQQKLRRKAKKILY
jgi:DNA primase